MLSANDSQKTRECLPKARDVFYPFLQFYDFGNGVLHAKHVKGGDGRPFR